MFRFSFFFLQAIFVGVPLIYAWLYIPGVPFDLSFFGTYVELFLEFLGIECAWRGFEAVKVMYFLVCMLFASVFFILGSYKKWRQYLTFEVNVTLWIVCLWILGSFVFADFFPGEKMYFFTGNYEKRHGIYFYFALGGLFFLLRSLTFESRQKLFYMSYVGFFGVVLYAIFQKIGLDSGAYTSRLDPSRLFTTLGNPNYFAGLILMITPLLIQKIQSTNPLKTGQEYKIQNTGIIIGVSGIFIYLTGSYLAWGIFFLYCVYEFIHLMIPDTKKRKNIFLNLGSIFIAGIIIVLLFWGDEIHEMQKMKGFIARWYLWKTGIVALFNDVGHAIFGYGPDGFLAVSERFRDWHLSNGYEDPAYRIDRAHNVFIDSMLVFGVPLAVAGWYGVGKIFPSLSRGEQISLIFFCLYFSFNIPVLVHYLILVLIVSGGRENTNV